MGGNQNLPLSTTKIHLIGKNSPNDTKTMQSASQLGTRQKSAQQTRLPKRCREYLSSCNTDSQCQRPVPQAPHPSIQNHNPPYLHLGIQQTSKITNTDLKTVSYSQRNNNANRTPLSLFQYSRSAQIKKKKQTFTTPQRTSVRPLNVIENESVRTKP